MTNTPFPRLQLEEAATIKLPNKPIMPFAMDPPPRASIIITTEPLSSRAFSSFGTVIENPAPHVTPSPRATLQQIPPGAVVANQGSAHKYPDVTTQVDLYASAPSGHPARPALSMFVCAPRELVLLQPSQDGSARGCFPVAILERHPFTTQTFIPLGLATSTAAAAGGARELEGGEREPSRYLVIVAPSLVDPEAADAHGEAAAGRLAGQNLPDLARMRAFVATGAQGVSYGPGTWHAPMVVVGRDAVSFVVAQYVNGVGEEDCQEVVWEDGRGVDAMIKVAMPTM